MSSLSLHARVTLDEIADLGREEPGMVAAERYGKRAARCRDGGDGRDGFLGSFQHRLGLAEELFPRRRQQQPVRQPFEQLDAQVFLQTAKLGGNGRDRLAELHGGAAQAPVLGDELKSPQLGEIERLRFHGGYINILCM